MQRLAAKPFFEAPSPMIVGIEELRPPREFKITLKNDAILDAQKIELLENLGSGRLPLPPNLAVGPGRSVVSSFSAEAASHWQIRALKMKGGSGLEATEGGLVMKFPRPHERFGVFDQPHLAIDENLRLSVFRSLPKGRFSLEHAKAENEFFCHVELAKHSLGFRPIAAGRLNTAEGEPVTNLNGEAVGVVFLENDPRYRYLFQYVEFYAIDHLSGGASIPLILGRGRTARQGSLADCLQRYQTFSKRLAQSKWRLVGIAGIARQVGHFGNSLYSEERDHLTLTDMDTSLLLKNVNSEKWGPQLLRDLASDLFRNVSMLSFLAYSQPYLKALHAGELNPFANFLQGFFEKRISKDVLASKSKRLLHRYNVFLRAEAEGLKSIAALRSNALLNRRMDRVKALHGGWNYKHLPFMAEVLQCCYGLVAESKLSQMGFRLPHMAAHARVKNFREGVARLVAAYDEERVRQAERLRS